MAQQQKAGKARPAAHGAAGLLPTLSAAQHQAWNAAQATPSSTAQSRRQHTTAQQSNIPHTEAASALQVDAEVPRSQVMHTHTLSTAAAAITHIDTDHAQPAPDDSSTHHPTASPRSAQSVSDRQQALPAFSAAPGSEVEEQWYPQPGSEPQGHSSGTDVSAAASADGAGTAAMQPSEETSAWEQSAHWTQEQRQQAAQQEQMRQRAQPGTPQQAQHTAFEPAQQAQHVQQAAFESQQLAPEDQPQALTSGATSAANAHRQPSRGQSVHAAKDYTPLEKYEAALVQAYAASYIAGAMLQHSLPAAANAVVSERHRAAVADVRRKNGDMKQLHLEEVKAERAAWQQHEEDIHL